MRVRGESLVSSSAARSLGAAVLFCCASIAVTASAADPRYRSYGQPAGIPIAFRVGGVSANMVQTAADFVTIGKLDGNDIGPLAKLGSNYTELAKRTTFLRGWHDSIPADRWKAAYYAYHGLMSLLGISDYKSMQDVLCAQMAVEAPRVDVLLQGFKASPRSLYVFEVANEPNLYPYIPPDVYAWYYYRWHRLVTSRAQAMGVADKVRIMPAGLWITKGLPASVLQLIGKVLGAPAADAELFYRQFLVALGRLAAANPNLSRCAARPSFSAIPEAAALAMAARFVDIGNLHFYPWVHETTSLPARDLAGRFAHHFAALGGFARLAATYSRTREVWLTETGNINPFTLHEMIGSFVAPLLGGLEALSRNAGGPISRWYWFKVAGEDSKLGLLDKVGAYVDIVAKLPPWAASSLGLGGVRELATSLSALRRQPPYQGLTDNRGRMRDFGAYYLRRAGVLP